MSDFYVAGLSATYRYEGVAGCGQDLPLVCYGRTLLAEPPGREWDLPVAEHKLVGRAYAYAQPTGNAVLSLSLRCLVTEADGAGAALAAARRREYTLMMHRAGTLLLCEAYRRGVPLLVTRWNATVSHACALPCTQDDAPPLPGGHARLEVDFLLTQQEGGGYGS